MSSSAFTVIGKGEFLPYLRSDLKHASGGLVIICPWIDSYFAEEVCKAASPELNEIRIITRGMAAMQDRVWQAVYSALQVFKQRFDSFSASTLDTLHAKLIVVDQDVYFGSANFYEYSLRHSFELGVKVPKESCPELDIHLTELFKESLDLELKSIVQAGKESTTLTEEISDPEIIKILKENPKAWVDTVGKKKKK